MKKDHVSFRSEKAARDYANILISRGYEVVAPTPVLEEGAIIWEVKYKETPFTQKAKYKRK